MDRTDSLSGIASQGHERTEPVQSGAHRNQQQGGGHSPEQPEGGHGLQHEGGRQDGGGSRQSGPDRQGVRQDMQHQKLSQEAAPTDLRPPQGPGQGEGGGGGLQQSGLDQERVSSEEQAILSSALRLTDFQCPICLELAYKPVVNVCGHIFCFWCVHLAMNPLIDSRCPMCRRTFSHFPAICPLLHYLLTRAFPEEYAARAAEVQAEEAAKQIFSPDVLALEATLCNLEESEEQDGGSPLNSTQHLGGLGGSEEHKGILQSPLGASSEEPSHQGQAGVDHAEQGALESELHPGGKVPGRRLEGGTGGVQENGIRCEAEGKAAGKVRGLKEVVGEGASEKGMRRLGSARVHDVAVAQIRQVCTCRSCSRVLFQPTVLNCGHAFCRACVAPPKHGNKRVASFRAAAEQAPAQWAPSGGAPSSDALVVPALPPSAGLNARAGSNAATTMSAEPAAAAHAPGEAGPPTDEASAATPVMFFAAQTAVACDGPSEVEPLRDGAVDTTPASAENEAVPCSPSSAQGRAGLTQSNRESTVRPSASEAGTAGAIGAAAASENAQVPLVHTGAFQVVAMGGPRISTAASGPHIAGAGSSDTSVADEAQAGLGLGSSASLSRDLQAGASSLPISRSQPPESVGAALSDPALGSQAAQARDSAVTNGVEAGASTGESASPAGPIDIARPRTVQTQSRSMGSDGGEQTQVQGPGQGQGSPGGIRGQGQGTRARAENSFGAALRRILFAGHAPAHHALSQGAPQVSEARLTGADARLAGTDVPQAQRQDGTAGTTPLRPTSALPSGLELTGAGRDALPEDGTVPLTSITVAPRGNLAAALDAGPAPHPMGSTKCPAVCVLCGMVQPTGSFAVCSTLHEALERLFPEDCALREKEQRMEYGKRPMVHEEEEGGVGEGLGQAGVTESARASAQDAARGGGEWRESDASEGNGWGTIAQQEGGATGLQDKIVRTLRPGQEQDATAELGFGSPSRGGFGQDSHEAHGRRSKPASSNQRQLDPGRLIPTAAGGSPAPARGEGGGGCGGLSSFGEPGAAGLGELGLVQRAWAKIQAAQRQLAQAGTDEEVALRQQQLRQVREDHHIHVGVGCDCCGVYPIVGRRFRCIDCYHHFDRIGFDLCGNCQAASISVGRFNQRHTSEHRLEEVGIRNEAFQRFFEDNPPETVSLVMSFIQDDMNEEGSEDQGHASDSMSS